MIKLMENFCGGAKSLDKADSFLNTACFQYTLYVTKCQKKVIYVIYMCWYLKTVVVFRLYLK